MLLLVHTFTPDSRWWTGGILSMHDSEVVRPAVCDLLSYVLILGPADTQNAVCFINNNDDDDNDYYMMIIMT